MFALPRKIISNITLITGLLLSGFTQADVQSCADFLDAHDYERAARHAQQILQNDNLHRSDERYAQLCLGRAYREMGRTRDALPAFQRVEALSQTTQELALAYFYLGSAYGTLNDPDRAELYGQRALKAFRELGDKGSEAVVLSNLAQFAKWRGDQALALQLYGEALVLLPETKQSTMLNDMATIHSERKEYPQAIKLLRQSIDIVQRNGNAHSVATTQIKLGSVLQRDKQYPAAEKELLAGLNTFRLVGDKTWEAIACNNLGRLANDDPKKSGAEVRQWFEKAEALYREIGDTANADRIAKLLAGK